MSDPTDTNPTAQSPPVPVPSEEGRRRFRRAAIAATGGVVIVLVGTILALSPRSNGASFQSLASTPASSPGTLSGTPAASWPNSPSSSPVPPAGFVAFPVTVTTRPSANHASAPTAPAPKSPKPPASVPPSAPTCSASVSPAQPAPGSTTNVMVQTAPATRGQATANFPSGPVTQSGTAGLDGVAVIGIDVPSSAPSGFPVIVDVVVSADGQHGTCSASFTPTSPA